MSSTDTPPPGPQGAPGAPPPESGPRVTSHEARDLTRLRRTTSASPEGRYIGGVAGGIARHLDIDPVLVRVAFVVLVFFGGAGLIAYVAGWLLIPEEASEHAAVSLDGRSRSLVLWGAAAVAVLVLLGDTLGNFHFPWPLAILLVIALLIGSRTNAFRGSDPRGQQGPTAYDAPVPGSSPAVAGTPTGGADAPVAPTATMPTTTVPMGYGAAGVPPMGTVPPAPAYVPPGNPRRRGPILFWFTLALIALLEGTLGIADAAGASIPGPAYAALAVGVTGAMLVLGAFWGRAGGLILVGLASTLALVLSVGAQEYGGHEHRLHATPLVAADVQDEYSIDAGALVLDLTEVGDPIGLDGRTIDLEGGIGKITVVVPEDWGVGVSAQVGIGNARILDGGENGGLSVDYSAHRSGGEGQPDVQFDAHLGIGSIEIVDENDYQPWRNR